MPNFSPKRGLTEDALHLLGGARKSLVVRVPPKRVRHSGRILRLGSQASAHIQQEALLLRYVSVVEAYCDSLMVEMLGEALPPRQGTLAVLVADYEERVSGNWQSRHKGFQEAHAIQLLKLPAWKQIEASIDARNSIAHALGSLTPRQRGSRALPSRLKLIDVIVRGNRIHIGSKTVSSVFEAARSFILDLDAAS